MLGPAFARGRGVLSSATPALWRALHTVASPKGTAQEHSSASTADGATQGWLAAGAATVLGAAGWLAARDGEPARAEAAILASGLEVAEPRAASVSEAGAGTWGAGSGLSFSFLSPEYRRNVFFIYEKRLRVHSPPEKVFEYFSSVKSKEGTFMTSLDLMRAAVPVFQPVNSPNIRSGFLGGEHRDDEEEVRSVGGGGAVQSCPPQSDFFKLFDTDGDGLISFPEYIFFITLLSLPESRVKSTFQQFDVDGSGQMNRDEFIAMMKVMRRSTSRGNATGFRTGLKVRNVDELSGGLVQYLFGDPGKEHKLNLRQFEDFLHTLRSEIDQLEFKHYDFTNAGSMSAQDFGYSVVAGANVQRMQHFIERTSKMASSPVGKSSERVSKTEFMAFCRLLKHGGTQFQAKVKEHTGGDKRGVNKQVFLKLAKECGAQLSDVQVDVLYFIFDIDGNGELSPEEFFDVVSRWE